MTKKSNSILEVVTLVDHDVVEQATAKDKVRELLQIRSPHCVMQYAPSSFEPCKGNLHYHAGAHVLVVEIVLDSGHDTHVRWVGREEPWSKRIALVPNDVFSQAKPLQYRKYVRLLKTHALQTIQNFSQRAEKILTLKFNAH